MDIRPNTAALLAPRSFTPRENLPVPGNPQAEQHRPDASPGIIPTGGSPEADVIENVERAKRSSVDFQIIDAVLGDGTESSSEIENTEISTEEPVQADASPLQASPTNEIEVTIQQANVQINVTSTSVRLETPRSQPEPEVAPEPVRRTDPIAFDLDNNSVNTSIAQQVNFDIDADGQLDTINRLAGDDAFLALDRNGDGIINNGAELFGDQHGAANGFDELAKFDDNQDGVINTLDNVFSQLRLFTAGSDETLSLAEASIRSINLDYQNTDVALNTYDRISQLSTYEREDGTTGTTADVQLGLRA